MISEENLAFLKNLKTNNNKEWFEANRTSYQQTKDNFTRLVGDVIQQLAIIFPGFNVMDAEKTIFRIFKDPRFSRNSAPYKSNFSAGLEGKKLNDKAGFYLQVNGEGAYMSGGFFREQPALIRKLKETIIADPAPFLKIVNDPEFKANFPYFGEKLAKINPNNPDDISQYLPHRELTASHKFTPDEVTHPHFADNVADKFRILAPFIHYLNTTAQLPAPA